METTNKIKILIESSIRVYNLYRIAEPLAPTPFVTLTELPGHSHLTPFVFTTLTELPGHSFLLVVLEELRLGKDSDRLAVVAETEFFGPHQALLVGRGEGQHDGNRLVHKAIVEHRAKVLALKKQSLYSYVKHFEH